jgi:hypothetical protein
MDKKPENPFRQIFASIYEMTSSTKPALNLVGWIGGQHTCPSISEGCVWRIWFWRFR